MRKLVEINNFKIFLIFIIGLLFGFVTHGLLEILAIWILLTWLTSLFFEVSWSTWYWLHIVSVILLEFVGLTLAFLVYVKYEKRGKEEEEER